MVLKCFGIFILAGLGTIVIAHSISAQSPAKQQATQNIPDGKRNSEAEAQADRVEMERREQASSLLISLASDARSFRDQTLRARTLARIADALWITDPERARELFRKAWESAVTADRDTARRRQADIERQRTSSGGGYAIAAYPNVRGEVLRLAGRRDRELGEDFLRNLKAEQEFNVNGENMRLALARDVLASGDSDRALQFASIELSNISLFTIDFLSRLRQRDALTADLRFAAMIDAAGRNVLSDANTVSLLSSYLFTPHEYIGFQPGGVSHAVMGSAPPPNVAPALQSAFFQMAANVLLRTPVQQQQETHVIDGQYLVMRRLLPFFEQHASRDLADAIRTRFEVLGAMVHESVRRQNDPKRYEPSEGERADREQVLLNRVERAKTSAERDQLYFQLAVQTAENLELRARDYVSKIDDSEFRKPALAFIDATLATNAIRAKKIELSLMLIEKGELTHIQRVWLQTQSAKQLAQPDPNKSLSLLEDAGSEARRIGSLDPDRPRALLAIANALRQIEPSRARDSVFEAVKAANAADGFTGEDGNLNILFQAKGFSSASDLPEPDFNIKGIFGSLATDHYEQTVELAQGFQGEAPRAAAIIAIAQAVLNKKTDDVSRPSTAGKK